MANNIQEFGNALYEHNGNIAIVTLNRPDRHNALGPALRQGLITAMDTANQDSTVRAVILTGNGRSFCSGGDLQELLDRAKHGLPISEKLDPQRDQTLLAVYKCHKPVIAAINGAAMGAGMNLALAADIRIASRTAIFAQSYTKRGMMPDYAGTHLLPNLVGYSKASELIFTGATVSADEALQLQIVSQVVTPEVLLETALSLAESIARNAPIPIRLAKKALQQNRYGDIREALFRETTAQNICYESMDAQEGFKAFQEKRAPIFKGS